MVGWLDRLRRRNRPVGVVIAVIYKYLDDQGGYLAALITHCGFVSLFLLLLLLLTTGLGVVLAGRPDLKAQVLQSTLSQFPVIGTASCISLKDSAAGSSPWSSASSARSTAVWVSVRRCRMRCRPQNLYQKGQGRTRQSLSARQRQVRRSE